MVNGSGNCGLTPGSQGQSGELAFQKCTWASTIVRLLAGCGRACCALVVSAAPATSVVPMNLRRVGMMVLPDGAALWQRFVDADGTIAARSPLRKFGTSASGQSVNLWVEPLATNSESAIRGLNFEIALILCTGRESKRTLRSINDDAASALVWVVDKLVEAYS